MFRRNLLYGDQPLNLDELSARAESLEAQVVALTQQLEEQNQHYRSVVEERNLLRAAFAAMPIGVGIVDADENVRISNAAIHDILGDSLKVSDTLLNYEIFLPDGQTKAAPERDPILRALRGQAVEDMESILQSTDSFGQMKWIVQSARPIVDSTGNVEGCVLVTRDITEHKELVRELDAVVAATVEEKRQLIEKLEAGVKELSTPIIEVWDDVLALPVIGSVDERRGAEMTSRVLDEVVNRSVRCVIIDWTGVEKMDGQSAQHIWDLVRCVELVGAECILTGIRPAVATALLHLDVRFEHLRPLRNVKFGLRYCLGRLQGAPAKSKNQGKSIRSSSSSTH